MRWLELTVQVHPEAVESVSELLRRYSSDGVVIEEPFELTDDGQDYRVLYGQPVRIHAYIPIDGKEEAARQQVMLEEAGRVQAVPFDFKEDAPAKLEFRARLTDVSRVS